MRIVSWDSVYPQVLAREAAAPGWAAATWAEKRERILAHQFGCWDSWRTAFRAQGHESEEGIIDLGDAALAETLAGGADALVIHNLARFTPDALLACKTKARCLVGHFSHAAPSDAHLAACDLLITAFPHFAAQYAKAGLPIRYLPLAFDPRRLEGQASRPWDARDYPVTFCGGLGHHHLWAAGEHAISRVAETVPDFQWWGYRGADLDRHSLLARAWRGESWGADYFGIIGRSRLTLNRHGEVHTRLLHSGNRLWYACNMRLFEATGMGACLLTEASENLAELLVPWEECVPFSNPEDLRLTVQRLREHPDLAQRIAAAGQARTLRDHTYARRAEVLAEWIAEARR